MNKKETLGMAAPDIRHQRIERNILYNYLSLYGIVGDFEIVHETAINPADKESKIPDIIFYDKEGIPRVIIEISNKINSETEGKAKSYIEDDGIFEVFYLNYTTKNNKHRWLRYSKTPILEIIREYSSKSSVLNIDIDRLIDSPVKP